MMDTEMRDLKSWLTYADSRFLRKSDSQSAYSLSLGSRHGFAICIRVTFSSEARCYRSCILISWNQLSFGRKEALRPFARGRRSCVNYRCDRQKNKRLDTLGGMFVWRWDIRREFGSFDQTQIHGETWRILPRFFVRIDRLRRSKLVGKPGWISRRFLVDWRIRLTLCWSSH